MTGRLEGKVAFITGAARGQGRAHAVRMANEGADIIAVDIAGISAPQAWNDITRESFKDVIDAHVTGTWNTVMAGAQWIIDGGRGGSIILISSAAGMKLQPFMVHYTASKHAVTGMARAFAAELGKHSVRVNSVHPGPVNTAMGSGDMVAAITVDQGSTLYQLACASSAGGRVWAVDAVTARCRCCSHRTPTTAISTNDSTSAGQNAACINQIRCCAFTTVRRACLNLATLSIAAFCRLPFTA